LWKLYRQGHNGILWKLYRQGHNICNRHVTPQGSGYCKKSTPEGSHVYRIMPPGT
jgi:hypothetical protein